MQEEKRGDNDEQEADPPERRQILKTRTSA